MAEAAHRNWCWRSPPGRKWPPHHSDGACATCGISPMTSTAKPEELSTSCLLLRRRVRCLPVLIAFFLLLGTLRTDLTCALSSLAPQPTKKQSSDHQRRGWAGGQAGRWAGGQVGRRAGGQAGRWAGGPAVPWLYPGCTLAVPWLINH